MSQGPQITMPGRLVLTAPDVSPEQALNNLSQVAGAHVCNEETRLILLRSMEVVNELVTEALVQRQQRAQAAAAAAPPAPAMAAAPVAPVLPPTALQAAPPALQSAPQPPVGAPVPAPAPVVPPPETAS